MPTHTAGIAIQTYITSIQDFAHSAASDVVDDEDKDDYDANPFPYLDYRSL